MVYGYIVACVWLYLVCSVFALRERNEVRRPELYMQGVLLDFSMFVVGCGVILFSLTALSRGAGLFVLSYCAAVAFAEWWDATHERLCRDRDRSAVASAKKPEPRVIVAETASAASRAPLRG